MLALETHIAARLRQHLDARWAVKGISEPGRRNAPLFASISPVEGHVPNSGRSAALVQITWQITLVTRQGANAADELDRAFAQAVAALHGWFPPKTATATWERMALQHTSTPDSGDDGLLAMHLQFVTQASFAGTPDAC